MSEASRRCRLLCLDHHPNQRFGARCAQHHAPTSIEFTIDGIDDLSSCSVDAFSDSPVVSKMNAYVGGFEDRVAGIADEDERAASPYAAQAKLLACRVAVEVSQTGQLLHGGWGYAEEYPISRYVVDAQVLPIFEGVEPILQLRVIGRSLLAG